MITHSKLAGSAPVHLSRIEMLESRIAPAITIVNAHTAKFTDYDGDRVTVMVSTGTLTAGLFITASDGTHDQIQRLNLSGGGFDGADVTVAVVQGPNGDGLADIGYLNSTGHDLGTVRIKGDLGRIDAGDSNAVTAGLKALTVSSMGALGIETQQAGNLQSHIIGGLGALTIRGNFIGAHLRVTGTVPGETEDVDGRIGQIVIGGSIIGGVLPNSGQIFATGTIGTVKIRCDVVGGTGPNSGVLFGLGEVDSVLVGGSIVGGMGDFGGRVKSNWAIKLLAVKHNVVGGSGTESGSGEGIETAVVGGSVIGGSGPSSGVVEAGETGFKVVKVGHDVVGGTAMSSGRITSNSGMDHVIIGGSLVGGSADQTGYIDSGDFLSISVGHDIIGGTIDGTESAFETGKIRVYAYSAPATIFVGGSIIAGQDYSSGTLVDSGAISVLGSYAVGITIKGGLIGHAGGGAIGPQLVTIRSERSHQRDGVDFSRISIGGDARYALIADFKADGRCGPVTVGGDWIASSLVFGGSNYGADGVYGGTGNNADNVKFGDQYDVFDSNHEELPAHARIASITIAGQVYGTTDAISATDHFGFVSEEFGPIKIAGHTLSLTLPLQNIASTGDVSVHKIAPIT